jgi:hypothetical protein
MLVRMDELFEQVLEASDAGPYYLVGGVEGEKEQDRRLSSAQSNSKLKPSFPRGHRAVIPARRGASLRRGSAGQA